VSERDDEVQRREQAVRWRDEGLSYTTICERLHRSRPWLAKWLKRARADPKTGLESRPRRPKHVRRRLSPKLVGRILVLRAELEGKRKRRSRYRGIGAIDIQELLREERRRHIPSISSIERVLRAHGCRRTPKRRAQGTTPYPALRAEHPGDLQQTDLVGPRYIRGARGVTRFYSLHTIAAVGRGVYASQHRHKTSEAFCSHFVRAWGWLGVPRISQLDNEMAATGGGRHRFGLSAVVRLHLLAGTHLVFVPPGEPGRNALVESFNDVWQERVLTLRHSDLRSVRRASEGHWRFYHERKPHRALTVRRDGTRLPGQWLLRHRAELRWLPAEFVLEQYVDGRGRLPVAAGAVSWIQRVDADGEVTINACPYFVGKRRTGEYVQATLLTRRRRLVIYSAQHRTIREFSFPFLGRIVEPVL
jgi:putative transposase